MAAAPCLVSPHTPASLVTYTAPPTRPSLRPILRTGRVTPTTPRTTRAMAALCNHYSQFTGRGLSLAITGKVEVCYRSGGRGELRRGAMEGASALWRCMARWEVRASTQQEGDGGPEVGGVRGGPEEGHHPQEEGAVGQQQAQHHGGGGAGGGGGGEECAPGPQGGQRHAQEDPGAGGRLPAAEVEVPLALEEPAAGVAGEPPAVAVDYGCDEGEPQHRAALPAVQQHVPQRRQALQGQVEEQQRAAHLQVLVTHLATSPALQQLEDAGVGEEALVEGLPHPPPLPVL